MVGLAATWWNDLKVKIRIFHFFQNARAFEYVDLFSLRVAKWALAQREPLNQPFPATTHLWVYPSTQ